MGLLSGIGDLYGGTWGNIFGNVGSGLNKLTGATQASNLQQRYNLINGAVNQSYALQSAALNNRYQKEFAQNAHQWEIEDLKKAGLNPVLSAGGSGASASGGGVSSGTTSGAGLASSGINPLDVILNGVSTMTTAKRTNAETKNIEQDQLMKAAQTLLLGRQAATETSTKNKIDQEILNMVKEIGLKINEQKYGSFGKIFGTGMVDETLEQIDKATTNIANKMSKNSERTKKNREILHEKLGLNQMSWKPLTRR